MLDLLARAKADILTWHDQLGVTISQAALVSGLEESQIRYFVEKLGVLQSANGAHVRGTQPSNDRRDYSDEGKPSPSGRRLYTVQDLRRLRAIALLLREDHKPRTAAAIAKQYASQLQNDVNGHLATLLRREGDAITDGFLLSRLMSQLIYACQAELRDQCGAHVTVAGLIFLDPLAPVQDALRRATTTWEVGHLASQFIASPTDMLIAIDRAKIDTPHAPAQALDPMPGQDDSTILFYSREHWEFPLQDTPGYCVYTSSADPTHQITLLIEPAHDRELPSRVRMRTRGRTELVDRLLALCAEIFPDFRDATQTRNHRYRSDGYPIAYTQELYTRVLSAIRHLVFPGVEDSMACLLVPNSLAQPEWLSILAYNNYDAELAARVKLQLRDIGQGISGRAYNTREAIMSFHAERDRRLAYGMEEQAKVALAIPLSERWTSSPFGVLYLASQREATSDMSARAFAGLLLGNIVSELVGRWWLTRLRRAHDVFLHNQTTHLIHWLESMDQHGPDFERALVSFEELWRDGRTRLANGEKGVGERQIALIVFDIDPPQQRIGFAESNEPFMLRAQLHVADAIADTLNANMPVMRGPWWFKNDHSLVMLVGQPEDAVMRYVRRIIERVAMLPLRLSDHGPRRVNITVSAAVKMLTLHALDDLAGRDDASDGAVLRQRMQEIVDDIYLQTRERKGPQTIWSFDLSSGRWRQV